jgi:diacylglycerol kinase (ATP)
MILRKLYNSFFYSIQGLLAAYKGDLSFRLEVWAGLILLIFGYLLWPLSYTELLFLILTFFLILITELINTAFEKALERLHPERHELIGASKDIASSAVLLAVIFAFIVVVTILINHASV